MIRRRKSTRAARPVEQLEPRTLLSAGPRVIVSNLRPGAEIFAFSGGGMGVQFDQPLKAVDPSFFRLERVGAPGAPNVAVTQARFDHGPNELMVGFIGTDVPGQYTLTFLSGDGLLEGVGGADLDGDMPPDGPLPSGDGNAGGDFVLHFSTVAYAGSIADIPPKQLLAWPVSEGEIELKWFDDVNYEYDYIIERSAGDGEFERIFVGRLPQIGYVDSTALPGEAYRYRVSATGYKNDVLTVGPPSNVATASVLPPDLSVPVSRVATPPGTYPDWLTDVAGTVFYTTPDSANRARGGPLWKSDGTPGGTVRLFDGRAQHLTNVNGTLFFSGFEPEMGFELWKSDGTPEGTVRVADVAPGGAGSNPRMLGVLGQDLLFAAVRPGYSDEDLHLELWKTDGTAAGTVRVTDTLAYLDEYPDFSVGELGWEWTAYRRTAAVSAGFLYFRHHGPDAEVELWRTDGTAPGTQKVQGLTNSPDPAWLTEFNGETYFAANAPTPAGDTSRPRGLYKLPGAAGPTAQLVYKPGTSRGIGHLAYLTDIGGALMFSADTLNLGHQLYRSDGTAGGTEVVARVNQSMGTTQYSIVDSGPVTYFFGNDYPPSLWKTDGTTAGTWPVRQYDFTYTVPDRSPSFLLATGDGRAVYSEGKDLWLSDGTLTGSRKVGPVGVEFEGGSALGFAGNAALVSDGKVFFSTKLPEGGRELRVAYLDPPAAPEDLTATPVEAPPAPAGVSAAAAAATPGGVRLAWSDRSSNESTFVIERSTHADFSTVGKVLYQSPDSSGMTDTSVLPGVTYYYRARAVNAGGASAYSNVAAPALPRVTAVYVSGGAWGDAFKSRLQSDGIGSGIYGYSLFGPDDSATPLPTASAPLPWVNLDRVTVQVDPATPLSDQDLARLATAMGGNVFTGFAYDAAANTATWTAPAGALEGPVDITFDAAGLIAGPLHYRLNVLAGDATRDGAVNALDLGAVKRALNATAGGAGYNPFADVTADGRINALDLGAVKQRLNRRLNPAAATPAAPTLVGVPVFGSAVTTPLHPGAPSEDLFGAVPILA